MSTALLPESRFARLKDSVPPGVLMTIRNSVAPDIRVRVYLNGPQTAYSLVRVVKAAIEREFDGPTTNGQA